MTSVIKNKGILPYLLLLLFINACSSKKGDLILPNTPTEASKKCDTSGTISYQNDILPIMNNSCGAKDNACHTSATASGQVILDFHDAVAAYAQDGRMMSSVTWDGKSIPMPKTGSKIPECDMMKIKRWITEGMPDN